MIFYLLFHFLTKNALLRYGDINLVRIQLLSVVINYLVMLYALILYCKSKIIFYTLFIKSISKSMSVEFISLQCFLMI